MAVTQAGAKGALGQASSSGTLGRGWTLLCLEGGGNGFADRLKME